MKKLVPIFTVALILYVLFSVCGDNNVTISLVGDILLDRGVEKVIQEHGADYPYSRVKSIVSKSDMAMGNLECPLTLEGIPVLKNRNIVFNADPANAYSLKKAGFDILNLANNHVMDYGSKGLLNTVIFLEKQGIATVGAGRNKDEAHKPAFIKKGLLTVGFISFSAFPAEGYFYFEEKPDVAYVDIDSIRSEIEVAREQCDFLIASFHWGREYDLYVSKAQRELAHHVIDSGADIIVGHHPHVLQGIESYKGKLIFYSLGNFVFDRQWQRGTDESVIINISVSRAGLEGVEIIPLKIKECQPAELKGEFSQQVLNRIEVLSSEQLSLVRKDGRGYIEKGD